MSAFVAANSNFAAGILNTIAASALNVNAGDSIVVAVRNTTLSINVLSITDSAGNIYRQACATPSSNLGKHEVWYVTNAIANAANIVTATFILSDTGRGIAVAQFSGLASISPLDVVVFEDKITASANVTSPSFTTAVANSVIVACAQINTTGTAWSPDSGYTEATEDADGVQQIQYKIVTAIQTGVTVTAVNSSTTFKSLIVITLHETLSGGASQSSAVLRGSRLLPYKTGHY